MGCGSSSSTTASATDSKKSGAGGTKSSQTKKNDPKNSKDKSNKNNNNNKFPYSSSNGGGSKKNAVSPTKQQPEKKTTSPPQKSSTSPTKQTASTQRSGRYVASKSSNSSTSTPEQQKKKASPTSAKEPNLSKFKIPNSQQAFSDQALVEHNKLRKTHHANELTLNVELAKMAIDYAKILADSNRLLPSDFSYRSDHLGENLLMYADANVTSMSGAVATQHWYNEGKEYNFESNKGKKSMRRFTQLLWKGSREVGFGCAKAHNGSYYCVALYYPSGNIENQYKDNLQKA